MTCGDYDNDGDIDIFLPGYSTSNTFLVNDGAATFRAVDIGSPIRDGTSDECASFADFDGDGFLDLFVPCGDGSSSPNLLYRNGLAATGNSNGWLTVALRGTVSNGSGIGAKVRVRATIGGREVWQMRQIVANGTWSSGTELVAHFGLGDADVADIVRVDWPSGNVQELSDVAIGRTVSITEPVRISPARPSASPGGSVRLASSVSGVSYRWQFEGQDIPGQTESSLSLSNLTLAAEGRYSLVIDTGSGLVTNFTWLLIDTTFTKVTSGPLVEELFNSWMGTWGDLDGDDDPDLALTRYVTGGTGIYRNDDEGVFQGVTNNVLPLAPGPWGSEGLADLDNDGRLDLIAMRYSGATEFYFNEGGFGFSGPTRTPLLSEAWNVAVADYDRDGWLDVFIPTPAGGQLWRNEGARVLRKVPAVEVGRIVSTGTFGGAAWGDYDDDGWPDLFAPNFRGSQSYLFRNDGGRFTSAVNLVAMDSKPGLWGAWGDYDNDGLLDLCVARFAGSEIYRNIGGGQFERTSIGVPFSGNSATWGDYDNDGYLDLVTTASTVLYRNNGDGTFTALANGSIAGDRALAAAGYVGAWCDYDQDGFLDLYVVNGNDGGSARTANFLYRNNGNSNGWLNVKLVGTKSNRQGIGAKVKVQANLRTGARWQRRDMAAGDTAGGSQWIAHFGLATASRARVVRIEWPSGTVQELMDIPARQTLTVVEPSLTGKLRSNGMFEMTVTCDTNKPYVLEQSIDLSTWTPFTTVTGSGVYVDPVPDPRQRFYRLR